MFPPENDEELEYPSLPFVDFEFPCEEDPEAAYSSTLLWQPQPQPQAQTQHNETTNHNQVIAWEDLTTGAQWIVLDILCGDGISEGGSPRGFASITTTVLRLSRAQIQTFLTAYITQYEAYKEWKKTIGNIDWDKLKQLAANANRSILDLLPSGRPALSFDRISEQEMDKAASFLRSHRLDRLEDMLYDRVGLNIRQQFLELPIEIEILQDCLDAQVLRRAQARGLIDIDDVERRYRDICDNGMISSRVPSDVFAAIRSHPSEGTVPTSQTKKGRRQTATTDKKPGRGRPPTKNAGNDNKRKKRADSTNMDTAYASSPPSNAGAQRARTRPQNCKEATEVREALRRQFFCHAQPFLPGRFVSTLVEQDRPPTRTFKMTNCQSGRQPPSKDVITVSRPASANYRPEKGPESPELFARPMKGNALAPSALEKQPGNPSNTDDGNGSSGSGQPAPFLVGYQSLKQGVVQDQAVRAGLNTETLHIHQGAFKDPLPSRRIPESMKVHHSGEGTTHITPVMEEKASKDKAAQYSQKPSSSKNLDRAAGFNKAAAPGPSDQVQSTAASQLREALDTRYQSYLESPEAPVPLRRERKPSRRARDNYLVDAAAAPDSEGDDDYVPGNEKALKRKRHRNSYALEDHDNQSETTYLRSEGNRRKANRGSSSAAAADGSGSSAPSEDSQAIENNQQASASCFASGVGVIPYQVATTPRNMPPQARPGNRSGFSSSTRKLEPIFGQYRNRVLVTQPGRLDTAVYAWSACQADFAYTAVKAQFAIQADRVSGGGRVARVLSQTDLRTIMKKEQHFMAAESAGRGNVGQDAERAQYAGCADFAVYALDAEEADFVRELDSPVLGEGDSEVEMPQEVEGQDEDVIMEG
ncbi:unnamed protein product [Clonostachys rosea]|uniref:Uncharacterized protein n=1 Tax=Bionectria ochroleuca TaxID=29856 RepID=A0ABY6U106_BIOOC|nr:unnamed protein product [Clonostachys rosea]